MAKIGNSVLSKRLPHPLAPNLFTLNGPMALIVSIAMVLCASTSLHAQAPAPAGPDTVIFSNGEKLVGHFEGFVGGAAKFKSDQLGEITIDLTKIQELHTSERFAVVRKGVKLNKNERDGQIPHGTVSITNQTLQVDPGNGQPAQTVAVGDLNDIVDQAAFDQAYGGQGITQLFHGWKGTLGLGLSLVEATQN